VSRKIKKSLKILFKQNRMNLMKNIFKGSRLKTSMIGIACVLAFSQCKKDKDLKPNEPQLESFSVARVKDCNCKHVIEPSVNLLNANNIQYAAGDTICVKAGTKNHLRLENFVGSPSKPIVVINCGGQVNIKHNAHYAALNLANCKYVKVTGTGDGSHKYGFKVSGTGPNASGVSMGTLTSDIEMEYVEVCNVGFAGILAKTDGAIGKTFENLSIHDMYIHDVKGEGMYIGETKTPGMEFKKVRIYNNIVTRTGWDLFQIANAVEDVEVYNNVFYDGGIGNVLYQNNGFQIGNSCRGKYYNNFIISARAIGIFISGGSSVQVYNNYIENMNQFGAYISNNNPLFSNSVIDISRNYFTGIKEDFFRNANSTNRIVITDNKLAGNNTERGGTTSNLTYTNNQFVAIPKVTFMNLSGDDFRLTSGSPYAGIGLLDNNQAPIAPTAPIPTTAPSNTINGIVITASSFHDTNYPINTMDGDFQTRWTAEGMGQWIKYDLGGIRNINSVDIAFTSGNLRTSYFDIAVSEDDIHWNTLFSGNSCGNTADFEKFPFAARTARYVKIVGRQNSVNSWNSISEIRINEFAGVGETPANTGNIAMVANLSDDAYLVGPARVNNHQLLVDANRNTVYMKFRVNGAGANHKQSKLRLKVNAVTGSADMKIFRGSHNNWTETNISNFNRPSALGEIASQVISKDGFYEFDVSSFVQADGVYTLILNIEKGSKEQIILDSKEGSFSPELILF
jgi:hypothetical protein